MNSKEALEWIKHNYYYLIEEYYNQPLDVKQCVIDMGKPKFYIIEQDLVRLETFDYIATQNIEFREENIKLKKVIEILKKYFGLMEYEEFEEYKIYTNDGYFVLEITKEEYDLLKEYLQNE